MNSLLLVLKCLALVGSIYYGIIIVGSIKYENTLPNTVILIFSIFVGWFYFLSYFV